MSKIAICAALALFTAVQAAGAAEAPSVRAMLDTSVKPCDDFYKFVCTKWKDEHPIPADQAQWGQFNVLLDANQQKLKTLLEGAAEHPTPETKRAGDFYAACMDEATVESKGVTPLRPILGRIDALNDKSKLAPLLAELHLDSVGVLFGFLNDIDAKDSTRFIAGVIQGGLGMPDRDYYLKTAEKSAKIRDAYVDTIGKMLTLAGGDPAQSAAKAKAILKFETDLAQVFVERVRLRNPLERNNPTTRGEFEKAFPAIDWQAYFAAMPVQAFVDMNDVTPSYFSSLGNVLQNAPLDDIKDYLRWHAIRQAAPFMSKAFVDQNFEFFGRTLDGTKELEPRWKRCVRATDAALGEGDLGKLFVEKYFPPAAKTRVLDMVHALRAAFESDIEGLDWMSAETKAKAKTKLKMIAEKMGYPDQWRDYASVEIWRDDLLGNVRRAALFERKRRLAKIGGKVDRKEWNMTPPTVNAYYSPPYNDINFPAGILQPPFFDPSIDDAVNFGGIGVVIGHEMTHGFDDSGRRYDGDGNLNDWWTQEDAKRFEARAQCIVDEYGNFVADGDVKLNGKLTLGENTADNGGARIAYQGLRKLLAGKGKKVEKLTPEQRFFIGMARVWCSNERPEQRRRQAITNPHSLPEYRVNGTFQNMPEFASAWSCKAGDHMVSATPCRVW